MKNKEEISEEIKELAVISRVDVRNYFRKLNYKLENSYMTKYIN